MGYGTKAKKLFYLAHLQQQVRCMSIRLVEVGKLEVPKTQGKYETGQLFLHKVFGYRGVILFPWVARLYERTMNLKSKDPLYADNIPISHSNNDEIIDDNSSGKKKSHSDLTYYQALMDERDYSHIRVQPDAVTFLGSAEDPTLYAYPGLDYVNHEDIYPYVSSSEQPIQHKLFENFLTTDLTKVPHLRGNDLLHEWRKKNKKSLEVSDVYRETTDGIQVTVIPFFMGVKAGQHNKTFWWRYCVRLENLTAEPVQLRERDWRIFSSSGTETVRGRGVVGQEPTLSQRKPAFQYSSHVSLRTPRACMWGTFRMGRIDGSLFEIQIPKFPLESKDEEPT